MGSNIIRTFVPTWIAFLPIIAGVLLWFAGLGSSKIRDVISIVFTAFIFLAVVTLYPAIKAGQTLFSYFQFFSFPLAITFKVDYLSFYLGLLISFIWFLAAFYSPGYMAGEGAKNRYYSFLLFAEGGCLGTVFAGDLLGLFLFFEFMALTSYVLVIHDEKPQSMFAGAKYLYMTIGGGLAIFFGMIIIYHLAGSINFTRAGLIGEASNLSLAAFIALVLGFGLKAGMFPVHIWLPDAHPAAPSPVSALLSGVMIKTGIYGIIRVFFNIYGLAFFQNVEWTKILLAISAVTILLGSALALLQDDLKRRLAYSSITQIGYIILGISLLTERSLTGGLYHIFTHAFLKGLLFFCAGAIIVQTGKRKISEMEGIGLQMPLTMIFFSIASITIIGIPPFNGFISKWQLCLAALEAEQPLFVVVLIASSLLNAAYYFPVIITAFFSKRTTGERKPYLKSSFIAVSGPPAVPENTLNSDQPSRQEAPWHMLLPMAVLATGCVIFALLPVNWPLKLVKATVHILF